MDNKRLMLALMLTAAIVGLTPILFPARRSPAPVVSAESDTSRASVPGSQPAGTTRPGATSIAAPPDSAEVAPIRAESTTVSTPVADYAFSNVGAAPVSVSLKRYGNLAHPGSNVNLAVRGRPLLRYRLVAAGDTIDMSGVAFDRVRTAGAGSPLEYAATVGGHRVMIRYVFVADSYMVRTTGRVESPAGTDASAQRFLLIDLPTTFATTEADTVGDRRSLAYVFKPEREDSRSVSFGSLDPGERRLEAQPLTWVAAKSKYFVVGLLTPQGDKPFSEATFTGGARTSKMATNAIGTAVEPIVDGSFAFELYAGPQEWKRLLAVGRDFDHVNPYGWKFMQGLVEPFATIVMRVLLWLHNVLALSYGWVLVIFGVMVRLILWPLNQSAMRSSMRMQQIHPRLMEAQKKHAGNRERQQQETMKIYKEEGVSPFTAITGCLPMLLPMPVLIALFFVFQNTIEFRGVSFLWLNDISIKDPYYILPLVMGASMYVLSWIGMRNAPPNPQAKMMSYVFPVMMTFFLLNLAAGLNLYYAVQNIAALPQQWLIARERKNMMTAKGTLPAQTKSAAPPKQGWREMLEAARKGDSPPGPKGGGKK